jgi:hypothetical protein
MELSNELKEKEAEYIRLEDEASAAFHAFCRLARQEGWPDDEVNVRIIRNACRRTPEFGEKEIKQYLAKREKEKARRKH